jgi:succinyl-CoA synthetase beta subunit
MRLYENISKQILSKYGVLTPKRMLASDASVSLEGLTFPVVIKAQVLVGGRGKTGGVRFAGSQSEARCLIREMIGSKIEDVEIRNVLVEEKVETSDELYVSVALDRDHSTTLLLASEYGGVDVEEIDLGRIFRVQVNPLIGIQAFMLRALLDKMNLKNDERNRVAATAQMMYNCFCDYDAELVEVNPLAITRGGQAMALDAKILVDDNAIFRHEDLQGLDRGITEFERKTSRLGVNGVEIIGEISVIASGAGCLMATADTIEYRGGKLGGTIDLGGSVFYVDKICDTVSACISEAKKLGPKVVLFNAHFQLVRCDLLAKGIRDSLREDNKIPIVVRLKGRADDEAQRILSGAQNVFFTRSFDEACEKAVQLAKGGL